MADEWRKAKLSNVCDIWRGGSPRPIHEWIAPSGIPWVKISDASGAGSRFIEQTREFIRPEGRYRSRSVIPGDLILSNSATPGIPMFMAIDACIHDGWLLLRNFRGIDKLFCYYLLLHERDNIVRQGTGTVFTNLKTEILKNHQVMLPSLREQEAIACILGSLDDKIELNQRMNKTLEAMAQAIFKSWFVDFVPVRAKAAGQQPPGLAPHIADLFPNEFEESELGKIPKEWKVYSLPVIVEVNPQRQLSRGTAAPYLDMAGMPTRGHAPDAWIVREVGSGMKFRNGDTLVARITPCLENGKTAYVDFLDDGEIGWGSTEYIVLRPREPIPTIFAYLLARSNEFRTFAIQQMTGSSGRQRVPADSLAQYEIVAAPTNSPVFTAFGQAVNPLFERIRSGMEQSRTLAALRDVLLPELISGELRVPDAERIVGRCV